MSNRIRAVTTKSTSDEDQRTKPNTWRRNWSLNSLLMSRPSLPSNVQSSSGFNLNQRDSPAKHHIWSDAATATLNYNTAGKKSTVVRQKTKELNIQLNSAGSVVSSPYIYILDINVLIYTCHIYIPLQIDSVFPSQTWTHQTLNDPPQKEKGTNIKSLNIYTF